MTRSALFPPWPGPSGHVSVSALEAHVDAIRRAGERAVAHIPGAALLMDLPDFDPVVYVALAADGDVLYVGQSHDLLARIARHRHAFRSMRAPRPVVWASVRVPAPLVHAVESGLIVTMQPQLNRSRTKLSGASRDALVEMGIAHRAGRAT